MSLQEEFMNKEAFFRCLDRLKCLHLSLVPSPPSPPQPCLLPLPPPPLPPLPPVSSPLSIFFSPSQSSSQLSSSSNPDSFSKECNCTIRGLSIEILENSRIEFTWWLWASTLWLGNASLHWPMSGTFVCENRKKSKRLVFSLIDYCLFAIIWIRAMCWFGVFMIGSTGCLIGVHR